MLSVNPAEVILDVWCNSCGAQSGEKCRKVSDRRTSINTFHSKREKVAERLIELRKQLAYTSTGEPIVNVTATWSGEHWSLFMDTCPYCGRGHVHSAGNDDSVESLRGLHDRVSHCHGAGGYVLNVVEGSIDGEEFTL